MSEESGYISLKDSQNPGNSYGFNKKYSEQTSERIDQAVSAIIQKNYKRTKELITKQRDKLEKMAKTLLSKEVLDHNDLKELLGDHPEGKYPEGIFATEAEPKSVNGKKGKLKEAKVASEEDQESGEPSPVEEEKKDE
jgi:cell division protease FtsH